jgi:hypothetical protein
MRLTYFATDKWRAVTARDNFIKTSSLAKYGEDDEKVILSKIKNKDAILRFH